jgi:hypothetical protein
MAPPIALLLSLGEAEVGWASRAGKLPFGGEIARVLERRSCSGALRCRTASADVGFAQVRSSWSFYRRGTVALPRTVLGGRRRLDVALRSLVRDEELAVRALEAAMALRRALEELGRELLVAVRTHRLVSLF